MASVSEFGVNYHNVVAEFLNSYNLTSWKKIHAWCQKVVVTFSSNILLNFSLNFFTAIKKKSRNFTPPPQNTITFFSHNSQPEFRICVLTSADSFTRIPRARRPVRRICWWNCGSLARCSLVRSSCDVIGLEMSDVKGRLRTVGSTQWLHSVIQASVVCSTDSIDTALFNFDETQQ